MEFPDLGKHCSEKTCKQLDFLPLKCDACEEVFCKSHITYDQHKCTSSYKKDVQVPVCPLCNTPIPVRRGETPDIVVGAHMDRDCKYNPTQQKQRVWGMHQTGIFIYCPKSLQNLVMPSGLGTSTIGLDH
uniref:AN1-type domain-containing protein n=1 Tax=Gopherus agassizii TaxID=38772 RepID=A0A452GN28_9SAUR